MTQINWDQSWIPYDGEYKQDKPLTLPNGKIFECDIKIALGNWAWDKGLTFAGVVSEDESFGFEINIKSNPDNPKDWIYNI
jgi:hypothetical protein